ncbi:hypothetical protein BH10BAC5_BH10BAC5_21470 [soil metagenome]
MDLNLMHTTLEPAFLILSLFFPRITLFGYWFFANYLPPISLPGIVELILGIFVPRILILIMIAENMGYMNVWFWLHIIALIVVYTKGGHYSKKRFRRRNEI